MTKVSVSLYRVAGERTAYEAFVEGYLGEQIKLDASLGDLLRDPDQDRLTNLMEFFLGTHPGVPTRSDEALTFIPEKTKGGTEVRIRFFRRADTGGLAEQFLGSTSLGDWIELGPESEPSLEMTTLSNDTGEYVPMEARVFLEEGKDESFFMRLTLEGSF